MYLFLFILMLLEPFLIAFIVYFYFQFLKAEKRIIELEIDFCDLVITKNETDNITVLNNTSEKGATYDKC